VSIRPTAALALNATASFTYLRQRITTARMCSLTGTKPMARDSGVAKSPLYDHERNDTPGRCTTLPRWRRTLVDHRHARCGWRMIWDVDGDALSIVLWTSPCTAALTERQRLLQRFLKKLARPIHGLALHLPGQRRRVHHAGDRDHQDHQCNDAPVAVNDAYTWRRTHC